MAAIGTTCLHSSDHTLTFNPVIAPNTASNWNCEACTRFCTH